MVPMPQRAANLRISPINREPTASVQRRKKLQRTRHSRDRSASGCESATGWMGPDRRHAATKPRAMFFF